MLDWLAGMLAQPHSKGACLGVLCCVLPTHAYHSVAVLPTAHALVRPAWWIEVAARFTALASLQPAACSTGSIRPIALQPLQQLCPANGLCIVQDWALVSSTKKMRRYHPPEVVRGMEGLAMATERLQAAAKQAWQDFLTDFAGLYAPFKAAVQAVAALDALNSLAIVAAGEGCAPCCQRCWGCPSGMLSAAGACC